MWFQIFMLALSYALSAITAPKPKNARPAAFADVDIPQTAEGSPQIWVFGDVWIEDFTVIGVGNWKTSAIKTKSGK